jgi:hypothetical protein
MCADTPCCRDNRVQTAAARIRGMPAEPERLKILTRELVSHEEAIQYFSPLFVTALLESNNRICAGNV